MHYPLISCLQLLRHISADDAALIESHFTHKEFKEGEHLFSGSGRVCRELYFVCSGVLRIVSENKKGMELTHHFYSENKFCTLLQSFTDGTPETAGIQASCNTEVLSISKNSLHELYQKLPWLQKVIEEQFRLQLIEKVNIRNAYIGMAAEEQYEFFKTQNPAIAARIPLKDIASYLGITPQSLSRIRKKNV